MNAKSNDPTSKLVDVDWDDPRLRDLLQKADTLKLEFARQI